MWMLYRILVMRVWSTLYQQGSLELMIAVEIILQQNWQCLRKAAQVKNLLRILFMRNILMKCKMHLMIMIWYLCNTYLFIDFFNLLIMNKWRLCNAVENHFEEVQRVANAISELKELDLKLNCQYIKEISSRNP